MPRPVWVVLPLQGEVPTLLDAVAALMERWPEDVDAELLVPTRAVGHEEAAALATLGSAVLPPVPGATLGELVMHAVTRLDPHDQVVLVDPAHPVASEPLRAFQLQGSAVLRHALDHRSLLSLIALAPVTAGPPPEPLSAPESRSGLLTAIVVAQGNLLSLRACLEHLQRGGPKQLEVVVVNNGAPLEVTTWLAGRRDVSLVRNVRRRTLAEARNQGLQVSHGEHVLVLDDTVLLPRHWSESLVLQGDLVAAGPVAHGLRGDQHDSSAVYHDLLELQALASQRRTAFRAAARPTTSLAASPALYRRADLLAEGGFPEGQPVEVADHELSQRLRTRGDLAVLPGVLAHVEAPPTAGCWPHGENVPLLSAALIVKDEQAALPACLASLRGVVDEVVVCDTGSSDATIEIARALGAHVVATDWDDDFAAARNAALTACRGTWVLSIDADEQLHVEDVLALREVLARSSDDAMRLPIRSRARASDLEGYEHHAARVLRREAVEWVGAIHEVPVRRGTSGWVETPPLQGIRLEHDGYLEQVRASRGKAERNLLLAEKDLARTPVGDSRRWKATYELARTLGVSDATAARIVILTEECLALDAPAHFRSGALVLKSGALLVLGRTAEAEQAARDGVALGQDVSAHLALATVLEQQGRGAEAADVLSSWTPTGHDPAKEQLLRANLERLLPGSSAYELEASDPRAALEMWSSQQQTTGSKLGRARCLLVLGRVVEAAAALEDLDIEVLTPEELLVVVAVAGAAGDRDTARWLLARAGPLPPALQEHADDLSRALRLASPDRVDPVVTSA